MSELVTCKMFIMAHSRNSSRNARLRFKRVGLLRVPVIESNFQAKAGHVLVGTCFCLGVKGAVSPTLLNTRIGFPQGECAKNSHADKRVKLATDLAGILCVPKNVLRLKIRPFLGGVSPPYSYHTLL